MALDRADSSLTVDGGLALRRLPHQSLTIFGESHHGGRSAPALAVGDNNGLAALHHGDAAVGRAQINAYCLSHNAFFLSESHTSYAETGGAAKLRRTQSQTDFLQIHDLHIKALGVIFIGLSGASKLLQKLDV
jgi:hypothetical protein